MREKYTALCPEPVMRATLVSSDSLRTTPTSPKAREHARHASTNMNRNEIRNVVIRRLSKVLCDVGTSDVGYEDKFCSKKTTPLCSVCRAEANESLGVRTPQQVEGFGLSL